MQPPSREQVASVLADIVHDALTRGESVRVPGLGAFDVRHQSSRLDEQPDGRIVLEPPRDEIAFIPEP